MLQIKKRFLTDEENHPVAVVIDLDTYRQIEELLENHGLAHLIDESLKAETPISLAEAKQRYRKLKKRA